MVLTVTFMANIEWVNGSRLENNCHKCYVFKEIRHMLLPLNTVSKE